MFSMALGLMTSLACLRTFGSERVVFWREAAPGAGMNLDPLAYFIAKLLVDLPRVVVLTVCVCVSFYPQVSPLAPLVEFVSISLFAAWSVTGVAYFVSVVFEKEASQLLVVVFILGCMLISGIQPTLKAMQGGESRDTPQYTFAIIIL